MPQTRPARNQRLRGNQLTELVGEVIPLCHESGARSNAKFLSTRFVWIRYCSHGATENPCHSERPRHLQPFDGHGRLGYICQSFPCLASVLSLPNRFGREMMASFGDGGGD